ncbi:MAG: DNA cytosine methyltransferase [Acidimicrobiales bacterium]
MIIPEEPAGTFVSAYSGAGGLDIGFALAGFVPVWANDLDAWACETYRRAFKRLRDEFPHLERVTHEPYVGSLDEALAASPPPSATLVIGGPPCQGFSVAGKMDPDDPRSKNVFRFFDVVEAVQPEGFVMENVRALYDNDRWAQLRSELRSRAHVAGYSAEMFLLKASHYGVPQARERMFFIGLKGATPVAPPAVMADDEPTLRDALGQLPPYGQPGNNSLCRAKVTIARNPVLRRSPWAGMLLNGAGRPMDLDRPAPTLPASMGGNKTPIIDQRQLDQGAEPWILGYHAHLWAGGDPWEAAPPWLRRITVEEAAAIQSKCSGLG